MKKWDGVLLAENKDTLEDLRLHLRDYDRAMARAIRAGLADHPDAEPTVRRVIAQYITVSRLLGQWDLLRRARSGVQKGVRRPVPQADLRLWDKIRCVAAEYERRHGRPPTQSMLRKLLVAKMAIPRTSRQGFHKLLTRLDLLHLLSD